MNADFGALVKHLRLSKQGFNEQGQLRQWSRERLATRSEISVSTLKSIEKGEHPSPEQYVHALAYALQLSEYQKHYFYAVAGLIYPLKVAKVSDGAIIGVLEKVHCPAYARTALWDFVAFNDYHRLLWDYDETTLSLLRDRSEGKIGANLLRVLFEKEFQSRLNVRRFDDRTKRAINVFRGESFQYVTSTRYKEIMRYFERNRKFQHAWSLSEDEDDEELEMHLGRTIVRIEHPKYGILEFLSARIPERYIGNFVTVTIYHPLSIDSVGWHQFQRDVNPNLVHRFSQISPQDL